MPCKPCEAKKKLIEQQQKQNLQYSPRPIAQPQQTTVLQQPKVASPKFQSPVVLPPLKN